MNNSGDIFTVLTLIVNKDCIIGLLTYTQVVRLSDSVQYVKHWFFSSTGMREISEAEEAGASFFVECPFILVGVMEHIALLLTLEVSMRKLLMRCSEIKCVLGRWCPLNCARIRSNHHGGKRSFHLLTVY